MSADANLLRQFRQEQADVKTKLAFARSRGDQRAVDFLNGQAVAFQLMIETVEVNEIGPPAAPHRWTA